MWEPPPFLMLAKSIMLSYIVNYQWVLLDMVYTTKKGNTKSLALEDATSQYTWPGQEVVYIEGFRKKILHPFGFWKMHTFITHGKRVQVRA